jgi:uncharacterized protein YciI
MPTYAVSYHYTDDVALRDEVRPDHREYLAGLASQDELLLAGGFGPGRAPGALLILRCESEGRAGHLVEEDPFRTSGVIDRVEVVPWTPVLGSLVPRTEDVGDHAR